MSQLADLIRQKYPGQYDDMSDDDLEKAVLTKHPEYKDLVKTGSSDTGEELKPENKLTFTADTSNAFNRFLGSRLNQLGGTEPGILNPNPEQNPLLGKSILPETTQEPGIIGLIRHQAYENFIRPMASPVGALGTFLGEGNPIKEPIGLPDLIKPEPELPVRQPRLLGPAPESVTNPPSFIAGSEGVAENRPYNINMGPVTPSPGLSGEGTILPREYGSVNQVPPDVVARYGLPLGKPANIIPTDTSKLLPGDVAPPEGFKFREGNYPTNVGEAQLPSALNRVRPETSQYTSKVLGTIEKGTPGLSDETQPSKIPVLGDIRNIVYRDSGGNPIAVAKLIKDSDGNLMVMDLAADKSKGLLTGRAVVAIGKKLRELNATTPAETVTPNAVNLIEKGKSYPSHVNQVLDQHSGFASGDIPKPPIETVPIPPSNVSEAVLPKPGTVKDISNTRAELGSVNLTLSSRSITKPIADLMTRAQDSKMQWIASTERELSALSHGLNKTARTALGKLIDGQDIQGATPELMERAQQARVILDNVFEMIPEGAKRSGKDVNYLQNYLTHLENQPDDILSGIKGVLQYHFGSNSPIANLFKSEDIGGDVTSGVGKVVYQRGQRVPSSPFTEVRTGALQDVQYDVNKVFPAYIESIAKVIFDKPATKRAEALIASLPESRLKELAGWYIKNYTKYDALPGLTQAWNNWAGYIARTTSRSLLSFNPGLQTLHIARLIGNMWPELGSKYSLIGLKKVTQAPIQAWNEAARNGLLYNEVRPLAFKTSMERFDSVASFLQMADYLDKAIGYYGFKQKFLDEGLNEQEAMMRAISETKRVSLTTDPSRITKTFAPDSPILGGAIGTLAKQYKQVPVKIVEQYMMIASNAKENPKALTRLVTGVGALLAARDVAGLHTFHLGTNIIPSDLWGAFGSAVKQVSSDLLKGDWQSAVKNTALWATPGGKSIQRQLKSGPSMFEPKKQTKIRFIS